MATLVASAPSMSIPSYVAPAPAKRARAAPKRKRAAPQATTEDALAMASRLATEALARQSGAPAAPAKRTRSRAPKDPNAPVKPRAPRARRTNPDGTPIAPKPRAAAASTKSCDYDVVPSLKIAMPLDVARLYNEDCRKAAQAKATAENTTFTWSAQDTANAKEKAKALPLPELQALQARVTAHNIEQAKKIMDRTSYPPRDNIATFFINTRIEGYAKRNADLDASERIAEGKPLIVALHSILKDMKISDRYQIHVELLQHRMAYQKKQDELNAKVQKAAAEVASREIAAAAAAGAV